MITVVSGLPRSGTSLMMRMLEAGGLPPLSDRVRTADLDNPNGYYEFEPVKRLAEDVSWLQDAEGKSIKVISSLLRHLPPARHYPVIFMLRDLEEILASQIAMLRRRGAAAVTPGADAVRLDFTQHLAEIRDWLPRQPHMEVFYCDYDRLVREPRATAKAVAGFLGRRLDWRLMAAAVDPALYRQRAIR